MSTDILAAIDGAVADYETSRDAMRWNPALREAREAAPPPALRYPVWEITDPELAAAVARYGEINAIVNLLFETLGKHQAHSRLDRIRCSICNPDGNPGRLAVNGDEYRRRQKARARRKR